MVLSLTRCPRLRRATTAAPRSNSGAEQLLVVVPTLNEGHRIAALLRQLQAARAAGAHVVLVDGGSGDDTCRQAFGLVDQVLTSAPSRGEQIALGIASSTRAYIWMLHADSGISEQHYCAVLSAFEDGAVWGRFDIDIQQDTDCASRSGRAALRCVALMMNLRTRVTGIVTGDHGIFCRRSLLQSAGGFPRQPLMEDIEVSRRLRAASWPVPLRMRLGTSARRWQKRGVVRTVVLMWMLRLRYFFGATPASLAREYYGE